MTVDSCLVVVVRPLSAPRVPHGHNRSAMTIMSCLVVVVRPLPAPCVPHGHNRSAMTIMTALVVVVRMVAIVMIGITMVLMDSAVVVVRVVPLGPSLMVQVVYQPLHSSQRSFCCTYFKFCTSGQVILACKAGLSCSRESPEGCYCYCSP